MTGPDDEGRKAEAELTAALADRESMALAAVELKAFADEMTDDARKLEERAEMARTKATAARLGAQALLMVKEQKR